MARETWLSKLKSQISNKLIQTPSARPNKKSSSWSSSSSSPSRNVGVLAFEVSTLISKLISLHHSLSDPSITRLRNDVVSLDGVRKIVSNDDSFLLTLACSEFIHTLHAISRSTAQMIISSHHHHHYSSSSSPLTSSSSFLSSLEEFASTGRDPHGWAATNHPDASALVRRADRYVAATSALYRELDELTSLENALKKRTSSPTRPDSVLDLQQKIVWQKQEIKRVKDKSLWNKTFDFVVLLLARLIFTVLARIKLVFGIGPHPAALPRSLSTSAAVFPSTDMYGAIPRPVKAAGSGFFESRTKLLNPPKTTLGSAALALHYANLIIVLEKMIRSPHLVGLEARDEVYSMLPSSIRSALRGRLRGRVGYSATDPVLAGEWRDALGRILGWLSPLAHNMIKWQNERSFEQHNNMMMSKGGSSNNVLLLQTLYFANKDKTEAAITELLVGLNYIWRFEREMNAKALLECSNFFFHNNNNMSHSNLQP